MWGTCKIVNFSWLLFSTLVIGQNLLTQKNTLSKWSVNAFYCLNGLNVGLCIRCVKMRTFLCGESTVAAQQKKLLSTLLGSLLKLTRHIFSLIIRTSLYKHPLRRTGFCLQGKPLHFLLIQPSIIQTPVNVANGHLLLIQSADSRRKSTSLMRAPDY